MTTQLPDKSEGDVNESAARSEWLRDGLNAEARELIKADAECYLKQALSTPCMNVLESSSGAGMTDTQGRRLLDFHGNSLHQVGYNNPEIIEAVVEQIRQLPFCPRRYTNRAAIDLGRKLTSIAPGNLERLTLCPGGTSAVGIALKLARIATGRYKTVSWRDSFHGASLDSISIGGQAHFREGIGPLLPGCIQVDPPNSYRDPMGNATDKVREVFESEGDIAAFIAEPIRCTSVLVPPQEYWREVRDICDQHGALLIFDEIPTGLGVTGMMFACQNFEVVPDILCLGKGLGGGVWPMAGILARGDLDVAGTTSVGHYTHEKSPGGCAAALATIQYIEKHNLPERARVLGEQTLGRLEELKAKHPIIGDVRGVGLLMAMELVEGRQTREPAVDAAEQLMYRCMKRGLSFKVSCGNIVTLTPSLVITDDEMAEALDILDRSLSEVAN
jgi:4-aminobutyrate aminotransferase